MTVTAQGSLLAQLKRALVSQQEALRKGDLEQLGRALSEADEIRVRLAGLPDAVVDQAEWQELLDLSRVLERELEHQVTALRLQLADLGAARQGVQRLRSSLRTPRPEARYFDHQA